MTDRAELMIGDFARRCRLPVSTLRYYDRIGLLTPAVVDLGSGYRHYTVDQLPCAALISRLRSLGVAPGSIERILAGGPTASVTLLRERQRIASDIELGRQRLSRLDELLRKEPPNHYPVEIVDLPARQVATLAFLLPLVDIEAGLTRTIARLQSALRRGGHQRAGAWGATFPMELNDQVSGFVFAPVAADRGGDLDTAWLPAARAAATVHCGSTASLPLAYHAIFAALDGLGVTAAGPVIEEYPSLDYPGASTGLVQVRIPCRDARGSDERTRIVNLEGTGAS